MSKQDFTPAVNETEDDFFGSLTGYDEAAVLNSFAAPIGVLAGSQYLRALIFVHRIRLAGAQATDTDARKAAKKHAMGLTIRQCLQYFAPDDDATGDADNEPDAGAPQDAAGEDEPVDAPHESAPTTERPSA